MLYEANKVLKNTEIIQGDLPNMEVIEEIRHKVKTTQGNNNRVMFKKLLEAHVSLIGNDIDNLGFYLDGDTLVGSTLFSTYIFDGTPLQNVYDKAAYTDLTSELGELLQLLITLIDRDVDLESKPLLLKDAKRYKGKDIWDKIFFTDDISYNVFLTRILLIQSEITSCIWMKEHLNYKSTAFNFDKYILLRLTSIKMFEIMRNIEDIRERLKGHWVDLNYNVLDEKIQQYVGKHKKEMTTLRNMLHYSNECINFYDYVIQQLNADPNYVDDLLNTIFEEYIIPFRKVISDNIDITNYQSMNIFEKIVKRLKTK